MRIAVGILLIIGMFVLPTCAYYIPTGFHKDKDLGLTPLQIAKMETAARQTSKIPPVVLQIVEASPETEDRYFYPSGTLVWYTIFGVEYGRTEIHQGQYGTDWNDEAFNRAWMMLMVPELAIGGLASLLFLWEWLHRKADHKRKMALLYEEE